MAVLDMNADLFRRWTSGQKPVLVEFWAPWCVYCRRIGPALEKIAGENQEKLITGRINIDDEEPLADAEGIDVVPTLVLYQDGRRLSAVTAPDSKAQIDRFLADALASAAPVKE